MKTAPTKLTGTPSPEVEAALEQVDRRIAATKDHLRELEAERKAVSAIRTFQRFPGLSIGATVANQKGEPVLVTAIDTTWKEPWVCGYPRRKDGELSTRRAALYGDWTILIAGQPPPPMTPPTPCAPI